GGCAAPCTARWRTPGPAAWGSPCRPGRTPSQGTYRRSMDMDDFKKETQRRIVANGRNAGLKKAAHAFLVGSTKPKYSYNFTWMGRPIIQYPQDMVAVQEIIWEVKPDLIIETGIAHGGSLIFYASILELI